MDPFSRELMDEIHDQVSTQEQPPAVKAMRRETGMRLMANEDWLRLLHPPLGTGDDEPRFVFAFVLMRIVFFHRAFLSLFPTKCQSPPIQRYPCRDRQNLKSAGRQWFDKCQAGATMAESRANCGIWRRPKSLFAVPIGPTSEQFWSPAILKNAKKES